VSTAGWPMLDGRGSVVLGGEPPQPGPSRHGDRGGGRLHEKGRYQEALSARHPAQLPDARASVGPGR